MTLTCLLSLVVFLEAILLRDLLQRAVSIKRRIKRVADSSPQKQLTTGTLAPNFAIPMLGTGQLVNRSKLKGHPSILLFISPQEASDTIYRNLKHGVHWLWHEVRGHLYLVCSGQEEPCRRLVSEYGLTGCSGKEVPILWDPERQFTNRFRISSMPQAVELDSDACVKRYGRELIVDDLTED